MIGGELWVGLGVGAFWVGRAVLESCVRGWRCSYLVTVIACDMWSGVKVDWARLSVGVACGWLLIGNCCVSGIGSSGCR